VGGKPHAFSGGMGAKRV